MGYVCIIVLMGADISICWLTTYCNEICITYVAVALGSPV
jgi:hypothetical protein